MDKMDSCVEYELTVSTFIAPTFVLILDDNKQIVCNDVLS